MRNFNYALLKGKKWDGELLNYMTKIGEYKGRQELFLHQKPTVLGNLVERATRQSTESSNRIEGIRTTDSRIKALLLKKSSPKNRDEQEILGYQDVLNTIHESYAYIPITPQIILQLHRDLYQYSDKSIGGKFKNTQNFISETLPGGEQIVRFTPLSPIETPEAMDRICQSYNREIDKGDIHPLILIQPLFMIFFASIRSMMEMGISRLLTTLFLYKSGYVVVRFISLEEKIERTKSSYYDALERSGIGWHENKEESSPFIKYSLATILSAYRDFEKRVDIFANKQSALQQVEDAVNQILGKFTKRDIMERTPTISRASVEKALKELVDSNKIERHGKGRATYYNKKE